MLLPTSFLLLALSIASRAIASPVSREADNESVAGTAYFITNDPSGNRVVSTNIGADGKLGPSVTSVSTGGVGAHGTKGPIGNDGLFSQGSVKVNHKANILATVNPGSNTENLCRPNSEGEFPMSVAINSAGDTVCVLNSGKVSGINCFTVHPTLGLVAKPNTFRPLGLDQTTPPTGAPGTASEILFSADDSRVMASVKGIPPTPGYIASWDIAHDGSLASEPVKSTPASGGLLPFSMTLIPGTHAVFSTDPGIGFVIYDFGSGSNVEATSTAVAVPGQVLTCWSSYSSKSGNYYLSDASTSVITEVHVDENLTGSIVKQYPQLPGSATLDSDVSTIGDHNYFYVLAANASAINVLSVDTPGKATPVQNFDFTSAAQSAGITFDKLNLQGMATFVKY